MGYSTHYTLNIEDVATGERPEEDVYNSIIADLRNINNASHSWGELMDTEEWGIQTKWYEYNKDFIGLSIKYPSVLFTLSGEGEGSMDLWRKFYLDGIWSGGPVKIIYPVCPWVKGEIK